LASLAKQTFSDFEVIVVDNFINDSCYSEFEHYKNDKRFKYYQPETPLPMADNWEFAVAQAQGNYISVISEKYMFREDAIDILFHALAKNPAELVTWWNETFTVEKFSDECVSGRYVPQFKPKQMAYYSPTGELAKRFSFKYAPYSRALGPQECLGKIYSGCFHRGLVEKIRAKYGRVFQPTMPDITSMTAALSLSPTCLDLGQPLMMVCASPLISNGFQTITNSKKFKDFYADFNVEHYQHKERPLKGLDVALNNYIAHDFIYFQKLSDNIQFKQLTINQANLLIRTKEDIDKIQLWENDKEKSDSYSAWQVLVEQLSQEEQCYIYQQLDINESAKPSMDEIHFAGGTDIGTYNDKLTAKERATLNWKENKVCRIKDEYLHYDSIESVMTYFTDYYQESTKLLKLI